MLVVFLAWMLFRRWCFTIPQAQVLFPAHRTLKSSRLAHVGYFAGPKSSRTPSPDLVHPLTFITFSSPCPLNPEPPVVSQQAVSFSATLISQILICPVPLPFLCSFHSFHPTYPKLQNHRTTYLNHQTPNLLPTVSHPNRHITQHRRMSNIRSIGIALDVGCPFEFRRVSVSCTHVPCLQLLELLLSAELVCLL